MQKIPILESPIDMLALFVQPCRVVSIGAATSSPMEILNRRDTNNARLFLDAKVYRHLFLGKAIKFLKTEQITLGEWSKRSKTWNPEEMVISEFGKRLLGHPAILTAWMADLNDLWTTVNRFYEEKMDVVDATKEA